MKKKICKLCKKAEVRFFVAYDLSGYVCKNPKCKAVYNTEDYWEDENKEKL